MIKRCTSGACRRVFRVEDMSDRRCPHCGKQYPRMHLTVSGYSVMLLRSNRQEPYVAKLVAAFVLPQQEHHKIHDLRHYPGKLVSRLDRKDAEQLASQLTDRGFLCNVTRR